MKNPTCLIVITLLLAVSSLSAATLYVSLESTNPTPPYATWATAAANIQDAVDAAAAGDEVIVTNGTCAAGGRAVGTNVLANRVAMDKPLTLTSVNGPKFTVIQGYQLPGAITGDGAIRCVYLTSGASLSGFTLTNGATRPVLGDDGNGGGLWCASATAVVSNCVLSGNSAYDGVGVASGGTLYNCTLTDNSGGASGGRLYDCTLTNNSGGGARNCTLNNCDLTGNSVDSKFGYGAGAWNCTLSNCTLSGNSAGTGAGASGCTLYNCVLSGNWSRFAGGADGSTLYNCTLCGNEALQAWYMSGAGGASDCTLYNSIVYFNTSGAGTFESDWAGCTLNYCCAPGISPTNGVGNITNAPLFVDYASGDLRLQPYSPCIDAGNNAYVSGATDLAGRPRIVNHTVDIGAYEFTGPFDAWLAQYGLPTDGSADFVDTDGDGMNNWQEYIAGTDPTNPLSVLRLLSATPSGANVTVMWQSVAGVSYFLERSTNLSVSPPFTLLATNLPGQPGTTSYKDTNATGAGPFFYRVGVKYP